MTTNKTHTIRQALAAMGYREENNGHWLKPIAYQLLSYSTGKNEWVNWFKNIEGKVSVWNSGKLQHDQQAFGSYLRQLKELEYATRLNMYNPSSEFELSADDLDL